MADMSKRECVSDDEHYWVESDEMEGHCRRKPSQ
jgi:hypothetical protein